MRAVLDTNVLVRAHKNATGPAREALTIIRSEPHVLVTSSPLLAELARVLAYPRVRAMHRLSLAEIQAFLSDVYELAEVVEVQDSAAVSRDPDDDVVVQTALAGKADVLCTRDRHLLRDAAVHAYCGEHEIQIMDDVHFLQLLRTDVG